MNYKKKITIATKKQTLELALPQVLGTCKVPAGHRGPEMAGREETSVEQKKTN